MDYIYFKYNAQAKPILADRDGEVNTNWVNGGTHVITADATHAHTGTKSFKLAASGTGDFTTNYASLASGNNSTFTVNSKYVIAIWIWCSSAAPIKIKTGGVTSDSLYCVANSWVCKFFTFTASSATTALQIISSAGAADFWFELEAIYEGDAFAVLIEKGLVKPEDFRLHPAIINEYLDGSTETQFQAFIRNSNLRTNALSESQELTYLYWTLNNDRVVDYDIDSTQETGLILIPGAEQKLGWYNDLKLTPYLEESMGEGVARTVFP